jgi:hypothetical protein
MMNSILTAEMLEMPQELFDVAKNLVTTKKHTGYFKASTKAEPMPDKEWRALNDQYKIDLANWRREVKVNPSAKKPAIPNRYRDVTRFTALSKDEPFGALLLNWLHDLIHQGKFEYKGFVDGKYTLHKKFATFDPGDGNIYEDFDAYFYVHQVNGNWVFSSYNEIKNFVYEVPDNDKKVQIAPGRFYIPYKLQQFTAEEIAASLGWTVEKVWNHDFDYFECELRDPANYLTSIFPRWSEDGTEFGTYINCQLANSDLKLSSLINEAGGRYGDYDIVMSARNSCEVPADHKDAESTGNFGECFAKWYETEEEAKEFTFDYDFEKPSAVKAFSVEWARPGTGQVNGHYNRYSAYFDLKTNKVVQ